MKCWSAACGKEKFTTALICSRKGNLSTDSAAPSTTANWLNQKCTLSDYVEGLRRLAPPTASTGHICIFLSWKDAQNFMLHSLSMKVTVSLVLWLGSSEHTVFRIP